MDAANVTQVEGIDFVAKDSASPVAMSLGKTFEHVYHASEKATDKVKEFGHHAAIGALGAVGLSLGLHEIWEKAKEANIELESAAKRVAGVHYRFAGWRSDISTVEKWNLSLKEGRDVVEKLEESEGKLKMTRAELADVYRAAYAVGARHNLSQAEMIDLTEKLAASQKVLGVSAEFAATSISRGALTGNIRGFDDFNKGLRFSIGNMEKFSKLTESARFRKIQKAMGDLMPAAEGMGKGMSGALFDMREAVEDIMRDVSKPVFREVAANMAKTAASMTKMREDGKTLSQDIGQKLVQGYHAIQSASAFIREHWKAIAAIYASTKLTGFFSGLSGRLGHVAATAGAAAGGAGVMNVSASVVNVTGGASTVLGKTAGAAIEGSVKVGLMGTVGKFTTLAGKASMLAAVFTEAYVAGRALGDVLGGLVAKEQARSAAFGEGSNLEAGARAAGEALQRYKEMADKQLEMGYETGEAAKQAKEAMKMFRGAWGGVIGPKGETSIETLKEAWSKMTVSTREANLAALGLPTKKAYYDTEDERNEFARLFSEMIKGLAKAAGLDVDKSGGVHVTPKGPPVVNMYDTRVTQEFREQNPERIFHRVAEEINDLAHNPRAAVARHNTAGGMG